MTVLSQSQIAGYAQSAGLSGNSVTIASAIAMAESGGRTDVVNPGSATDPEYSVGLWQINLRSHPQYTQSAMSDPTKNAAAMFAISAGGTNWLPWGTYTNGDYKQFLGNITPSQSPSSNVNTLTTNTAIYQTTAAKGNPDVTSAQGSGYVYILAYTIAISIFVLIAQSRAGYRAIYYTLLLCILFLLVTHSTFIADALAPITTKPAQVGV